MTYDMILPNKIDKLYSTFPAVGSRVKITYVCEYEGQAKNYDGKKPTKDGRTNRLWTRKAVVVQKAYDGLCSHFTAEILPEAKLGKRGRYKLGFSMRDVVLQLVRVEVME
jgi:hypothetical protein